MSTAPIAVETTSESARLPSYAPELADFHRAFADDLRAVIERLPLQPEMRVLDVGCGDGFYGSLIADRLSNRGSVVGADTNRAYLELARRRLASRPMNCRMEFCEASIHDLPFPPGSFDLIWCAQSLYSLPDPDNALKAMRRAVRPGGIVAILENDTLHQILLPWPGPLEIALRAAEYTALSRDCREPEKYYLGRRLPAVLGEAGFIPVAFYTQCIDRCGPLNPPLERFVTSYLQRLAIRVKPSLDEQRLQELERLISSSSDSYLLRQPHFIMSWINVLAYGRRPTAAHTGTQG